MVINSLRNGMQNMPSVLTIALAISIAITSTKARAANAVVLEVWPIEETRHWWEQYDACVRAEEQLEKQRRDAYIDEWNKSSPEEAAVEWKLPNNISKPIFDALSELRDSFGEDFSDFDSTSRKHMGMSQKILQNFFSSLYDARHQYTEISQPQDAEYFLNKYDLSLEEAQKYEEHDRKYYLRKLKKANEAQREFIDSVDSKSIRSYYDLLPAVEQSDDKTAKDSLQQIFDFAKTYAASDFFTDNKLIQENDEFNSSVWESVLQQYNDIKKYNRKVIYPQQHTVLDKLGRKLFPGKKQEELTLVELDIIGQLEWYITEQHTSITFDVFLKNTKICIPDFVDISVLSDDFMRQLQREYKNIPAPKNSDFDNLNYKWFSVNELFSRNSWYSIFSSNLELLRYDVPVEQVLENINILLGHIQQQDKNPGTAYNSYQRYTYLRELLGDYRENPRLQWFKKEFNRIFEEVRKRQNQQLGMYKKRQR